MLLHGPTPAGRAAGALAAIRDCLQNAERVIGRHPGQQPQRRRAQTELGRAVARRKTWFVYGGTVDTRSGGWSLTWACGTLGAVRQDRPFGVMTATSS